MWSTWCPLPTTAHDGGTFTPGTTSSSESSRSIHPYIVSHYPTQHPRTQIQPRRNEVYTVQIIASRRLAIKLLQELHTQLHLHQMFCLLHTRCIHWPRWLNLIVRSPTVTLLRKLPILLMNIAH